MQAKRIENDKFWENQLGLEIRFHPDRLHEYTQRFYPRKNNMKPQVGHRENCGGKHPEKKRILFQILKFSNANVTRES